MTQNHRKQTFTKLMVLTVTGNLLLSTTTLPVLAANDSTQKEEVVYANLSHNGEVEGIYVVNSFSSDKITDYGNYTDIRNLTTTDEILTKKDKITIKTNADKIYYQGDLKTKDLPWNITLHYYIDGKEYSASELAGKSGELKITFSVTKNSGCDKSFWEGYALQTTLTFDTKKCNNIHAEGATIANVGSDKQVSYLILPDKGGNFTITADVTDFEMDGISINGTRLNLDMEFDEDSLNEQVAEIQDAASKLSEGAASVDDGTGRLQEGANALQDGSAALNSGANTLSLGLSSLNEGIATIQNALNELDKQSKTLTSGSSDVLTALDTMQTALKDVSLDTENLSTLSTSSTQINAGISSLVTGLQSMDKNITDYYATLSASDIDLSTYTRNHDQMITLLTQSMAVAPAEQQQMYQQIINLLSADKAYIEGSSALISGIDSALEANGNTLMNGAVTLKTNYAVFDANIQSMVTSLNSLAKNMSDLKSGIETLNSNYKELDAGITAYTKAVSDINTGYASICKGASDAATGASSLYQGTADMLNATKTLYQGSSDLKDGTLALTEGTNEFYENTKDVDTKISDKIDETVDDMTGANVETISFVSEKNTNVDSVLFVIKTPAIEKEEAVVSESEPEKETGFFEKFKALFRKEK